MPGNFDLSILSIHSLSLLCTCANHLSVASLAGSPNMCCPSHVLIPDPIHKKQKKQKESLLIFNHTHSQLALFALNI